MIFLFQWYILRFHVNLPGCIDYRLTTHYSHHLPDDDSAAFFDNVFAGRWMSSVGETRGAVGPDAFLARIMVVATTFLLVWVGSRKIVSITTCFCHHDDDDDDHHHHHQHHHHQHHHHFHNDHHQHYRHHDICNFLLRCSFGLYMLVPIFCVFNHGVLLQKFQNMIPFGPCCQKVMSKPKNQ